MNRRAFLSFTATKKGAPRSVKKTSSTQSGIAPYAGAWTNAQVAHLLKRTMFGATKSDIDYFSGMSLEDAVSELLSPAALPQPPVRDYGPIVTEDGTFEDSGTAPGQTWVNDLTPVQDPSVKAAINNNRMDSLRKWWAGLMLKQNRSINEKMILFWHHHFSVQKEEANNHIAIYRHHDLLRRNVLGNVRQLTVDVSKDPAMLMHLNGYLNSKVAPDENYARELQELFTVGKGPDSQYTEDDVMAAARVLTGWRVNSDTMESFVDAGTHDGGTKTFSSFYNNTSIAGGTAASELDQLIGMIFNTSECPRFIVRKIYRWFVNSAIDADTETNVIIPLAQIFKDASYEIKPVLEVLFRSEHFFDPVNMACYIKSPFDFIVGALREFNVSFPDYTDYVNGYPLFFSVYRQAANMQQDLFQPPDVSGWPAYHQEPMFYELWVNSNSLPRRAEFTDNMIGQDMVNVRAFASYANDPSDPDRLIDDVTTLLLRYPLSASSKSYLKNNFLVNNGANAVWTNAWNANEASVIDPSLKKLFQFITNLPEYHLC